MSKEDKEKKNFTIKINVSKQADSPKNGVEPKFVAQWNFKRIIVFIVIMIILIVVGINIFQDADDSIATGINPQKTEINKAETEINLFENKKTESKHSTHKDNKDILIPTDEQKSSTITEPVQVTGELIRAQLARGIWKDEPFGKIFDSIKVNDKEATGVFYFTEFKNMKGKTIFHIWKFEDKIIFKKKKDIPKNHWKTHSSKLFTKRSVGFWSVETVDSDNQQLNIINFDVVAE